MTRKLLATLLALGLAANLQAEVRQSHQCERYGIQRTVELVSADGASVPCQVVYSKPMEDQSSTSLWTAQNDASFCQTKYDGFIVKLESKLNWSCTANTTPLSEAAPENTVQAEAAPKNSEQSILEEQSSTKEPPTPTIVESSRTETPEIAELPQLVVETPTTPKPDIHDTSTAIDGPDEPRVFAALPARQIGDSAEQEISLERIRLHFPTGHYTASTQNPHSGNTSLCPAGGIFIWNTQRPDKPTFEMGSDATFIFNLNQVSDPVLVSVGGGSRTAQCDYDIRSSYCVDNQLQGQNAVSAQVANALECRSETVSNSASTRPLALMSTVATPPIQACASGAPSTSMGLAGLSPNSIGSGGGEEGLEIVIRDGAGANANCRYVRGR